MLPGRTFNENYGQDIAIVRTRLQWGLLIFFLIFLLTLPLFASSSIINLLSIIGITAISVLGLNILTGYTGQISLGQAAFMAVGAYTSAIMVNNLGLSFWLTLPCAGLMAGLVGLIFGLPSLKVKGFYLAITTLAAQLIIVWLLLRLAITGGALGVYAPYPQIGNITFTSDNFYYIIIPIAAIMTFLAKNIVRTRVGRAFIAIRDNDISAEVMGIDIFHYKLLAFLTCSFYAGIAGALYAFYLGRATPDAFPLMDSIWYLGMVIVGGMGSTAGAIFGVCFMRILQELVSYLAPMMTASFTFLTTAAAAGLSQVFFGVVILLFLIFEPRGLAHRWEILKNSYRLWPFPYGA